MLEGDEYLRAHKRESSISKSMIAGIRRGRDVLRLAELGFPHIEELGRFATEMRSTKLSLFVRGFIILTLVVLLRVFFILSVDDGVWNDWMIVDRAGVALSVFILCAGIFISTPAISEMGWTLKQDTKLQIWFQDYMLLSEIGSQHLGLVEKLRSIRVAEIRAGVDGQQSRERLYIGLVLGLCRSMRRKQTRWPYVVMMFDLVVFSWGLAGFVLIPFIAWLESSSAG